jgi:hypothetical protein
MNFRKNLITFLALMLVPQAAFAYLDPASLAMAFQVVVAAVVGTVVFFRGGYKNIKDSVFGIFKSKAEAKNKDN